jgi:glycosyltransferase involved in cell wall biosynthesis
LKVAHIISGLGTGGAERALYNLLQGGLAKHFNCQVISLSTQGSVGNQIRKLDVPVTNLGMSVGRPSFSKLQKMYRLIREFRPDLIQGWMYHGNLAAYLVCFLAMGKRSALVSNIRCSLYDLSHEKLMTQMVIRANRFFSFFPDAIIYNSLFSKNQHETSGYGSKNGNVIPNGIDVNSFSFSSVLRQKARSKLCIPEDVKVIGHVARLHPMKEHSLFLKVAVDIAQRYPETHFILCGKGVSLSNSILAELVPVQMRNRFHLLGERSDVPEIMCAMDIFCLCSSWGEGFPNVIGEAMAIGLPCVATDVGDSSIIVGKTGVIVPPCNEQALSTGLENLLSMPDKERRALGVSAEARIHANYTLEEIVGKYIILYEELMKEKGLC